jgi:hypothetical protein
LGPGDKLGKHDVIRRIAVGSVAELYLTRTVGAEGLEKLACVKRVLPQFASDPSFVAAFASEARLAATLSHPNIAQVIDVGQELGETFFSMEYVHGEDLGRLVTASSDNGVPISLDCALSVAAGLCAGLHHAHEKAALDGKPVGMVHRDVSPTNVIVSYDGAVKLVDFGIARATGEPIAPGAVLKGKISYMSPEQARGRGAVDRRSDVFSVGTILYQLTTGRLPFIDETEPGVRLKISSAEAPPPSQLVPGYAPALEAIVMRALARDPEQRFATAMALQNQIEDFAHEHRLRISPIVLARLMSTLFPARLEEWDHARAQGAFFVEQHVVRTLIESGKTADGDNVPQPLPAVDSAGTVNGPRPEPEIDLADRTELGPQPKLSPTPAPPRAGRPSQAPIGAAAAPRAGRASLPGMTARPSSQPGVTARAASQPRPSRPSQPLSGVLPSVQRPGRSTQQPGLTTQPRPGRSTQQPPIASPQAAERELPVPQAIATPAPSAMGQPAWPQPASAHPAPQAAAWPPPASSLQSWAANSSSEASPWAANSSPEASPWAGTSSPEASPWAGTSSPDAAPWTPGHPAQSMPMDPFGSQPSSQDLRLARSGSPPVPGMPGAVPIMVPMSVPPVPSGGTLVSSATLAGNQPPPVRPVHGPFGQGGLDGFAGQNGLDNFTNHAMPGGPPQAPSMLGAGPPGRSAAAARDPAAALPTLQLRAARKSSLPMIALAVVGAAAIAGGAWFVVGRDDSAAAPSTASTPSTKPEPAKPEPAEPSPTARPAPSAPEPVNTPDPAQANAAGSPPATAPEPAAAPPTTPASEPSRETAQIPAPSAADEAKPEPPKKKPVVALPDPRTKAAKPRPRVEPKRGVKSQPKEQPWNDDSPFMPVATPKR